MRDVIFRLWKGAPRSGWEPHPWYDCEGRPLPLATIEEQLREEALRCRGRAESALARWATTGKWPPVKGSAAYLLREMIRVAWEASEGLDAGNSQADACGRLLTEAQAKWLTDHVAGSWYAKEMDRWARDQAGLLFYEQQRRMEWWSLGA